MSEKEDFNPDVGDSVDELADSITRDDSNNVTVNTYSNGSFHAKTLAELEVIKKDEGLESLRLQLEDLLRLYTHAGSAHVFELLGKHMVSGSTWLDQNDLSKSEQSNLKRMLRIFGVSDFYAISKSGVVGFPLSSDLDSFSDIVKRPSIVTYMDVIRQQYDDQQIKPAYVCNYEQASNGIAIHEDRRVIDTFILGQDTDKVIRTYILRSDNDYFLTCSFFPDGRPVPGHDRSFDPRTNIREGIISNLNHDLSDYAEYLGQIDWVQYYFVFEHNDDVLYPESSQERLLRARLDSKAIKMKKKKIQTAISLAVLLGASGYWYWDYNSIEKQKQRVREAVVQEERRAQEESARITTIVNNFYNEVNRNAYVYPVNQTLYAAVKNILTLPPVLSEGKMDDEWRLSDWNCYSPNDVAFYYKDGVTFECAVNYVGDTLAQDEVMDEWGRDLSGANLKYSGVQIIQGVKAAPLKYSFTVFPVELEKLNEYTPPDLIRELESIAEQGRAQGFSFGYSKEKLYAPYLEPHREAIEIIKTDSSHESYFAFQHTFSLSAELGALGASNIVLPKNSTISQINGSNSVINIKGITKYEDKL